MIDSDDVLRNSIAYFCNISKVLTKYFFSFKIKEMGVQQDKRRLIMEILVIGGAVASMMAFKLKRAGIGVTLVARKLASGPELCSIEDLRCGIEHVYMHVAGSVRAAFGLQRQYDLVIVAVKSFHNDSKYFCQYLELRPSAEPQDF